MEMEQTIAELWKETLAQGEVSRDDNFFALGGNSLIAMELTYRMSERLGVSLSAVDLFLNPTPRLMAQCVRSLESG